MTVGTRRNQMIADRKLQSALLAHAAIYWFYCLFSVTLITVCWIIFTRQPESSADLFMQLWLNCGPALLGSVVLLPLVLLDCLRLSNRFAGPMVRMKRAMRELAAGETPPPITLRPEDYWAEFAEDFNLVMERLRQCPRSMQVPATRTAISESEPDNLNSEHPGTDSTATFAASMGLPVDGDCTTQTIYSNL